MTRTRARPEAVLLPLLVALITLAAALPARSAAPPAGCERTFAVLPLDRSAAAESGATAEARTLALQYEGAVPPELARRFQAGLVEIPRKADQTEEDAILAFADRIAGPLPRGAQVTVKGSDLEGSGSEIFFIEVNGQKTRVLKAFLDDPETGIREVGMLKVADDAGLPHYKPPKPRDVYRMRVNGEERLVLVMDVAPGKELRSLFKKAGDAMKAADPDPLRGDIHARMLDPSFETAGQGVEDAARALAELHTHFPTRLESPEVLKRIRDKRQELLDKIAELIGNDGVIDQLRARGHLSSEDAEFFRQYASKLAESYRKLPITARHVSVTHDDAHLGQFFHDPATGDQAIIDTEKMARTMMKLPDGTVTGFSDPMTDVGKLVESIEINGIEAGMTNRERNMLQERMIWAYLNKHNEGRPVQDRLTRADLDDELEFHRLVFDRVLLKNIYEPRKNVVDPVRTRTELLRDILARLKSRASQSEAPNFTQRHKQLLRNHVFRENDGDWKILVPRRDGTFTVETTASEKAALELAESRIPEPIDLRELVSSRAIAFRPIARNLSDATRDLPGVKLSVRVKEIDRLKGKLLARTTSGEAKGDAYHIDELMDLVGARFVVRDTSELESVVKRLSKARGFKVLEQERIGFPGGPRYDSGYRAVHLGLRAEQGTAFEAQIMTERTLRWSNWQHDLVYKGDLPADHPVRAYAAQVIHYLKALDDKVPADRLPPRPDASALGIAPEYRFPEELLK